MSSVQQIQVQMPWPPGFFEQGTAANFRKFHVENPHILKAIIKRALILKRRGHKRVGMKMIFEVLRFDYMIKSWTDEPFKLDNSYTSYYTRLVEFRCPELVGLFEKRKCKSGL